MGAAFVCRGGLIGVRRLACYDCKPLSSVIDDAGVCADCRGLPMWARSACGGPPYPGHTVLVVVRGQFMHGT